MSECERKSKNLMRNCNKKCKQKCDLRLALKVAWIALYADYQRLSMEEKRSHLCRKEFFDYITCIGYNSFTFC